MKPKNLMGPLLWSLVACGGGTVPPQPAPGATLESEGAETMASSGAVPSEDEASGAAEPIPASGPSTIRVDVQVAGQPVAAEIRILDDDRTVASGASGQAITTESGEYAMEVQVQDGLIDRPIQHRTLTLLAGGDVSETVEFPWAKIQLAVRINGALSKSATVDVIRDGEVVATMKSGAKHVLVSPGRYQAVVKTRGAKIEVQEVMFPAEATQTVPVAVQM